MVQVTSPTSLAVDSPQGRKLFVFDKVFGEDIYQDGVWEYVSESVSAFVQGYNVSVLAYGQSGAGKSFTMGTSGPAEQGDPKLMGRWREMTSKLTNTADITTRCHSESRSCAVRQARWTPKLESQFIRHQNSHKILNKFRSNTSESRQSS